MQLAQYGQFASLVIKKKTPNAVLLYKMAVDIYA